MLLLSAKLQEVLTHLKASPYVKAVRRGLPLFKPAELLKELKWHHLKAGLREQGQLPLRIVVVIHALMYLIMFVSMTLPTALLTTGLLSLFVLPVLRQAWEEFKRYALGEETKERREDDFNALIRRLLRDYADAKGLNAAALAALEEEYLRQGIRSFKEGEIRAVWRSAPAGASASRPRASSSGKRSKLTDRALKALQERVITLLQTLKSALETALKNAGGEGKDAQGAGNAEPRKPALIGNLVALAGSFTLTLIRRLGLKSRPAPVTAAADAAGGTDKGKDTEDRAETQSLSSLVIADPVKYLYEALHTYVDLGEGFNWTAEDTEEALRILDPRRVSAEMGHAAGERAARSLQLLGLERFRPLYVTRDALRMHCVVFGSTGAGKTHFLLYRIAQAVLHGETVIILDPKSDRNLREAIPRICELCGRREDFAVVDLCDVEGSARFNPIADRVRNLEISERLTAHLPTDGASLSFKQKSQQAIEAAVDVLTLRGRPLTLLAIYSLVADLSAFTRELAAYLRDYAVVKGKDDTDLAVFATRIFGDLYGGEDEKAITQAQDAEESAGTGGAERAEGSLSGAVSSASKGKSTGTGTPKKGVLLKTLRAFYTFARERGYFNELLGSASGREHAFLMIERVFTIASMSPDFYPKVAGAALPLLSKLSTGDLSRLFSAETMEPDGQREVLNASKAIAEKRVLYFSLHCLIDADLGSGVGRLLLSELRSVAGLNALRMSRGERDQISPVSVFVDEASEVACESLIQLLNKSRSCGFSITLASQTAADWEASTGKRTALDQILGNCNTLVSFRVLDEDTSGTIEKSLPKATQLKRSSTIGFAESFSGINYSGSRSLTEETAPLFPSSLLMRLPSLEYVARLPEGRVIKGRVPVLSLGDGNGESDGTQGAEDNSATAYRDVRDSATGEAAAAGWEVTSDSTRASGSERPLRKNSGSRPSGKCAPVFRQGSVRKARHRPPVNDAEGDLRGERAPRGDVQGSANARSRDTGSVRDAAPVRDGGPERDASTDSGKAV